MIMLIERYENISEYSDEKNTFSTDETSVELAISLVETAICRDLAFLFPWGKEPNLYLVNLGKRTELNVTLIIEEKMMNALGQRTR